MAYIKLDNAGVSFCIYNSKTRSVRTEIFRAIGGRIHSTDSITYVDAIDGIDLEIKAGDRVGIIGHNGAGKSTTLKLLSGIYEPTKGSVKVEGKISSLTDITMGMDPESSGYDNIIMRCIFMGMTLKEARSKVDEIIEFSELQEYIHLPVRTYSTGMYLRLAFTTATCVVPDILIMDEMIGTGDSSFIEKARNRMINLIEKTSIMAISSHNIQIMKDICNRGIWMEKGKIKMDGPILDVLDAYEKSL
ncbi:MAG: ABC transporter ATP-binding protein [Rickettsiaceae bacterium]|nr:ABC transporter ATP-binding protein [Rickettsiaceae bacterium]